MIVEDTTPWYRQFWPWFVFGLPATVVVAGLVTVFIAFHHADTLVDEDYFKEGLAINRQIEQELLAEAMGLTATVTWDNQVGEILVALATLEENQQPVRFDGAEQLMLKLQHPTDQHRDQQLTLTSLAPGYYRTSVDRSLQFRYYLKLTPLSDKAWRLKGEMDFTTENQIVLGQP